MTRARPVVALVLAIAVPVVARSTGVTEPLELRLEGTWARTLPARPDRLSEVVVIGIDDAALERIPDPLVLWGPLLATAIREARDAGATAIGLDLLVAAGAEEFFARHGADALGRTWDAPLREAVFDGRVVLAATIARGRVVGPRPDLAVLVRDPHGIAFDVLATRGGVVTGFEAVPLPEQGDRGWSLALALATLHAGTVSFPPGPIELAWAGPPGTVEVIPFGSVLDGVDEAEAARLAGRVVLVGATHAHATDRLTTVHTLAGSTRMPAVEAHAHAVAALLTGRTLARTGPAGAAAWEATLALAATGGFFRGPLGLASAWALALTGVALGVAGGAYALDRWVPAVSPLLAVGVAFAAAFGLRFAGEERERRRVRSLFGRFVAEDVVAWALRQPTGVGPGGVERVATVLFCDIRGFTTLSERLGAADTMALVNAWLGRACPHVAAHGGIVDKYLGDGFVAVFGAPVPHADHAARGVAAACAIAAAVEDMRAWLAANLPGLPAFDVGIGLHTGPLVAGPMGYAGRLEYTTLGDATNVASRVEGLTKEAGCRVLATEATVAAAGAHRLAGRGWTLPVKGRAAPAAVCEILWERAQ